MSETIAPPADWYPDPDDDRMLRWWNGSQWQEQRKPAPPPVSSPPAPRVADGHVRRAAGTNKRAVASLVLSLLWMVGLGSVAAIVLGVTARRQMARSGQRGDGLAISGIAIGAFGLLMAAVSVAIVTPVVLAQQARADLAALDNDLRHGAIAYGEFFLDNDRYPGSLAEAGFEATVAGGLQGYITPDARAFCIEGQVDAGWRRITSLASVEDGRC